MFFLTINLENLSKSSHCFRTNLINDSCAIWQRLAANICFALVALHKFSQIENENERKPKFSALSPTLFPLCFIIIPLWAAHLAVLIRQSLQIPQFRMPARLRARERIHLAQADSAHLDCIKNQLNFTAHGVSFMETQKEREIERGRGREERRKK